MKKNLQQFSNPVGRKRNVDFTNEHINISRQAVLLSINRGSIYRKPPKGKRVKEEEMLIMRRIDEIHTIHPTWATER